MKKSIKFKKKYSIITYKKGMSTQDCIDILQKRTEKREKEMAIYEPFYKKFLSLQNTQKEELSWLKYLKENPNFITGESDEK